MLKSERELLSSLSPTELARLQTIIDAGSAANELLADDDVRLCLAALQGTTEISSTQSDSENSTITANRRFSDPRFVGSGAFGIVFFVFDNVLGFDVAIKLLRPSRNSPVAQQRFLEEAKITASLSHTGIVRMYDSGTIGQIPYISSAIVAGGSLADAISEHPEGMKPEAACRILQAVAEAVAFAHSKLTYHRDIKPSNILMQPEGNEGSESRPVLTDFGLAKRWDRTEAALTLEGDILGTSRYMSPEQASGLLEDYSVASEVFTLGIILHEMLTGKVPFDGKSSTEIRKAIVQNRPLSLRQLRPGLSSDLIAVVQKCLEKLPGQRYESVAALSRDLQRYLAGQPVEASRPSLLRLAIWNAKNHPLVTGSLMLTMMTICFATVATSYAWLNQLKSSKRERQTKVEYVILFGKLVDDVVAGEKDQQTAILESLRAFQSKIEEDLQTNPQDEDLRHLMSLLFHYQSVTLERVGNGREALKCRIDSVAILQKLRNESPKVSKYRFQYVFGIAALTRVFDALRKLELLPHLQAKTKFFNETDMAEQLVLEIDQLLRDFRTPAYENACNRFKLDAAEAILVHDPKKAIHLIERVIADTTKFAQQNPDTPMYIKPALEAHWQLARLADLSNDGESVLKHADDASACFETYLRGVDDKLWVKVQFHEKESWRSEKLHKYGKFAEALASSEKCLTLNDELVENPALRVSMIAHRFSLQAIRYLCKKELGQTKELETELRKLIQTDQAANEFEGNRIDCHNRCLNWKLPESVVSVFEAKEETAP